jgi:hypothetical protein
MAGFPSEFAVRTARPFMRNNVVAPRIAARNPDARNELRFRRDTQLQNGLPITIWPYSSFTDTTPMDVPPSQSEVPVLPPVIAMSGWPNGTPDRTAPERPADYSYVAGCHAIPNGHHCDLAHNEAAAP